VTLQHTLQMSTIDSVIQQFELYCWQQQRYTPRACRARKYAI